MKRNKLTSWIAIAMVSGVAVGYLCHTLAADAAAAREIASYFTMVTDIFLRLIKMIIAPLVLATLIGGLAGMGDAGAVGRIGGKALAWFITASLISIGLGLVMVNLFQPGVGAPIPDAAEAAEGPQDRLTTTGTWSDGCGRSRSALSGSAETSVSASVGDSNA